jgi:hypothetical protein
MAHFAKLNNNIVEQVIVVSNDVATTEQAGIDFLKSTFGSDTNWKQTSYNTRAGVHELGGTPFRKNYAVIGATYDEARDAFIHPQPYPSWTLNETTCWWEAPVEYPYTGTPNSDLWNEETQSWM